MKPPNQSKPSQTNITSSSRPGDQSPRGAEEHSAGAREERASRRLAAKQTELAQEEAREPLRRRILACLAEAPANPAVLAASVGAAQESVSRQLTALREANLVHYTPDFADRRRKRYSLTVEGEIQLADHRAFGAPEPPAPDPTADQVEAFLRGSLQTAVRMRRKTNRLADASARLTLILDQAQQANAHDLFVDAAAELATTLRQDRRFEDADELLETLQLIGVGRHALAEPNTILPAAAHFAYALGRMRDEDRETIAERAEHLVTAVQLYAQLAERACEADSGRWRERQAWGLISLANNLRARSRYDDALDYTGRALKLFDELEDPYGRARCSFMFGFCLRLIGDFDGAAFHLQDAHDLAAANAFERFQADALMQLGEVRRCQGNIEDATMMLDEALQRARNMKLTVIHAFALSARGAVFYQTHDPDRAAAAMHDAHALFEQCDHLEGLALNARRHAIAIRSRSLAGRSSAPLGRLIEYALKGYRRLKSPAGMAACEVELSRLQLNRSGDAEQTLLSLTQRLDDPQQQPLLVRDPWVPRVLDDYAATLDSHVGVELRHRTTSLLAAAERWREQVAARRAARDSERTGPAVQDTRVLALERFGVDEMGGETRRYQEPVASPEYTVC